MARVRSFLDGRIIISISIAEPLQVLIVPFGCAPLLAFVVVAAGLIGLVGHSIPVGNALLILLFGVPTLIVSGFAFAWAMSQSWEFNRLQNTITVRRGPLPVRSETLQDMLMVRVDEHDDGDGGSAQAKLVYRDGREIPVNRVNTGSINELKAFADAANRFLAIQNNQIWQRNLN